jgi:hypothetical protein
MDLDYSTLTDAELDAIANNDYSKLSDNTLAAIAAQGPQPEPQKTMGEYTFGEAANKTGQIGGGVAGTAADLAVGAVGAIPGKQYIIPGAVGYGAIEGFKNVPRAVEALKNFATGAAIPAPQQQLSLIPKQPGMFAGMATNLSPATMLGAPYAMAGLEAQNIRKYPNAPGYKDVPYAQMYRGEAATQNTAGEGNRMKSLANMPFTGVNSQERAILDEDRMMRQNIRKKAYEKVMGPVVPGSM